MRISPVLVCLGLSMPMASQADVIGFHEQFYVRFDSFYAYSTYGKIVDYSSGEEISAGQLVERYGIGWYTGGFELGDYRSASLRIESEDGSLSEDKITSIRFGVDGCYSCGAYVIRRTDNNFDTIFGTEISAGNLHEHDGSILDIYANIYAMWESSILDVFLEDGSSGSVSVEQVDDKRFSRVPYDPITGYAFGVPSSWDAHFSFSVHDELPEDLIPAPIPASILFLLAGMGGLGVMARRTRRT